MCAGKDCRKLCEFSKIRSALEKRCDVAELKCVGICSGTVVVTNVDSAEPRVFAKLKTKQHRKELLRLVVDDEKPSAQLAKREVAKGKKKVAVRKARRAVA